MSNCAPDGPNYHRTRLVLGHQEVLNLLARNDDHEAEDQRPAAERHTRSGQKGACG